MAPAQSFDDPPRFALWPIEPEVAAVGVGLENAAPLGEMALRMFAGAVARGVEQRRRRPLSTEGAVVANIDPDASRVGLALGENGNRGVVAVQAVGGQDMGFDQRSCKRPRAELPLQPLRPALQSPIISEPDPANSNAAVAPALKST